MKKQPFKMISLEDLAGPCYGWLILQETRRPSIDTIDRSTDPIDRPIQSIDSIDSIIFCSFENFSKDRLRRDDRFCPKIVKIRAILAIFRPFENFCEFRFDRFDIPFDSIDIASEGHGGLL